MSGQGSDLRHWRASSCLGFVLTGQWRPLCSVIHCAEHFTYREAFQRWADRYFDEPDHTLKMHANWLLGTMLRGPLI